MGFIELGMYGDDNYKYGDQVIVKPGTQVTGVMTLASSSNGKYTYIISFAGYPSIDFRCTFKSLANAVQQAWEPFTDTYKDFPPDKKVTMKSMQLIYSGSDDNQPITWSVAGDNGYYTKSGKNTVVRNNGTTDSEVDFYFR